jgi:hypothetical protein
MTQQTRGPRVHERWAHLRFSVIGQLLAAPPAKGELKAAIDRLAGRTWQHPTTGGAPRSCPRPEPSLPEAWAAALGAKRQRRRHHSRRVTQGRRHRQSRP